MQKVFDDERNITRLARFTLQAVGQYFIWVWFIDQGQAIAKGVFGDFDAVEVAKRDLRDREVRYHAEMLDRARRKYEFQLDRVFPNLPGGQRS